MIENYMYGNEVLRCHFLIVMSFPIIPMSSHASKSHKNSKSRLQDSGGSKEGREGHTPPRGPNSFNFMQFLGKFGKIICWRPPGELAPPPRGNPRSATAKNH